MFLYRKTSNKCSDTYSIFEPQGEGEVLIQTGSSFERGGYLNFLDVKAIQEKTEM